MKICFPQTNRVHKARQQLLLDELSKWSEVVVADITSTEGNMASKAGVYASQFNTYLRESKPDLVLCRGDRFEMLPIAMVSAYRGIPIAHLEAGDRSGVIDNSVRGAVSWLSKYHFATNKESAARLSGMGFPDIYDYGSLDVEYTLQVPDKKLFDKPYMVVLYHQIPNEDAGHVKNAVDKCVYGARKKPMRIVGIRGNDDYTASEGEEYSPEDFVNLLRHCEIIVTNSSAGIKEAPALGCKVVNIGTRQMNRLKPENVLDVRCDEQDIYQGIKYQMARTFKPSTMYSQPDTSKNISDKLRGLLST